MAAHESTEFASLARRALHHFNNKTTDQAAAVMEISADAYRDPARYAFEVERIYKRVPVPLALSIELPESHSYRAMTVLGIPVVLVRGDDKVVRAFVNACAHRGAAVCPEGSGKTSQFVCRYHAWRYDLLGRLKGISDLAKFGEPRPGNSSLQPLPCVEKHGLVWVCLTPGCGFELDDWLAGMGIQLDSLELESWYLYEQRELAGPGWKVAWDGYLEAYHHQTVHLSTLAQHTVGNLLVHDVYGPHQRLTLARKTVSTLNGVPESAWDAQKHLRLIHSVFPSLSVSGILGDHCLVTQLFPGPTPEASTTRQTILAAREPLSEADKANTRAFSELALAAVRDEDYKVTATILAGLRVPGERWFQLGRNEPAIQHYHRWLAMLVTDAAPASLPGKLNLAPTGARTAT